MTTFEVNIGSERWPHMAEATVDANGVMRWTSNNRVPFADVLAQAVAAGHPVDVAASNAARDVDTAAFLEDYRRNARPPSGEELAEMRSAFGAGTTVVNVITGRRTRL